MHVPVPFLVAAFALLQPAIAVLVDDAWKVDYHLALLGPPQEHATFFHQPFSGSKASLLYTVSEQAVLGAVNPKDGAIVWRQPLSKSRNATQSFLRSGQDQDSVISAVDGEVAAWSAADGRQIWSTETGAARVRDLEIIEIPDVKQMSGIKDVVVLSSSPVSSVVRIDGKDGHVKWSFVDESGDEPFQVSASATEIHLISLHTTMLGGIKIKVISLDPTNGHKVDQYMLATESDLVSTTSIITVGANSASPIIAWVDKSRSALKVNIIGTKAVTTFPIDNHQAVQRVALHAPYHANARPHFLVHYQTSGDHWAEVYHVDLKQSTVSKAYSLPRLSGEGAFSTSSSGANVYFTRISESEVFVFSSASHGILARWTLKAAPSNSPKDGRMPLHAVSEVSVKDDTVSAVRSAVYLTSGDWVLVRDGLVSWERPEVLSTTENAVWAYPSIQDKLVQELEVESHTNFVQAYIHRVNRHLRDLTRLPNYLQSLPNRLLHSVGIGHGTTDEASVTQDSFGFHKIIVCATNIGRLIALDAGSSGKVIWNRPLVAAKHDGVPQLVALPDGSILLKSSAGETLRRIDGATGADLKVDLTGHHGSDSLDSASPRYTYSLKNGKLVGASASGLPAWTFAPVSGQEITMLTPRPFEDPVASIAKVLGDRRVLYKYLNPNLIMVTATSSSAMTASITIIDAVSGFVLYTAYHDDVDVALPISSTISENWFTYSYASATAASGTKGYQLVVGEMYESPFPNDRGPRGSASNSSSISFGYEPHVVTQSYHIGEAISHMAVTQTRQGITSRLLLAVLPESNAIVGIPRSVIDPRRPVGRDPTPTEAMEGLMRYDPVLRFDPKWYLTHQREVIGIKEITASPATMESTSLVFAYGLDIFGTRNSPSFSFDILGKDFNKLQMLATVAALAVATLAVAPLVSLSHGTGTIIVLTHEQVKRKQINARWQFA